MFYVYALKRSDNPGCPIFYIGKGSLKRAMAHLGLSNRKVSNLKNKIISKVLRERGNIETEILGEFEFEDDAFAEEKRLILLYGRIDIGTGFLSNHTDGGERAERKSVVNGGKGGTLLENFRISCVKRKTH